MSQPEKITATDVHNRIVKATSLAKTIADALYEDREGADVLGAISILVEYLGDTGDAAELLAYADGSSPVSAAVGGGR